MLKVMTVADARSLNRPSKPLEGPAPFNDGSPREVLCTAPGGPRYADP